MAHLDKKKSKERKTSIIDFHYIFFGRHKHEKQVRYFTVFIFFLIFVSVLAFYLQPQQQIQQQPQERVTNIPDDVGDIVAQYRKDSDPNILSNYESDLRAMLAKDSKNDEAALSLASLLLFQERRDEALSVLVQVKPQKPMNGHGQTLMQGKILEEMGDLEGAKNAYLSGIRNYPPARAEHYYRLAEIYRKEENLVSAEEILRQGLANFPVSSAIISHLADVLAEEGKTAEAQNILDRNIGTFENIYARNQNPSLPYHIANLYFAQGMFWAKQSMPDKAIESFLKVYASNQAHIIKALNQALDEGALNNIATHPAILNAREEI